jgi:hypothetical protein
MWSVVSDVKCSPVMWSVATWREHMIYVKWFYFEVKWSEVIYGEALGDKSTTYIRVILYWGYLILLWLFHLVCILYCGCFNLLCNVWVSVCESVLTIVWCFGKLCNCIYCVSYRLYCVFLLFRLCIFNSYLFCLY